MPALDRRPDPRHALRQLAARRHVDAEHPHAGIDRDPGPHRAHPRSPGDPSDTPTQRAGPIAQQADQLAASGSVGIDPLRCGPPQGARVGDGNRAPVRLREQLGLEPQVDVGCGNLERKLLRRQVVFSQRHRERQRDAGAEPPRVGRQVAVDDLCRQRPAGPIETR